MNEDDKGSASRRQFLKLGAASVLAPSMSLRAQNAETRDSNSMDADIKLLQEYAQKIKPTIFKQPQGMLRFRYLTAGVNSYPYLVDWDAIWGGMSYLIDGDPDPLRESLLNLLDHVTPDGKGQRVIQPDVYGAPVFHNRPFLAMGAFVLTRHYDSASWMPDWAWEKLHKELLYWHVNRTGRHGMVKWWQVDEGLSDNGLANWTWDLNSVEASDLNAQMVVEHCAAAYVASKLHKTEQAAEHRLYAERLHQAVEHFLWNDEDSFYYSMYNSIERERLPTPIKCLQSTNLWPVWMGSASPDRARRVLSGYVLSSEHFWSAHGVRSMSVADQRYNNAAHGVTLPLSYPNATGPAGRCSNWQGPIWSITNYLAAIALRRYGFPGQANDVAAKVVRLHADSIRKDGVMHENYDAESGRPLGAEGGLASWALMLRFLPRHLKEAEPWILKDLELPS